MSSAPLMLSHRERKLVTSLRLKKYREREGLFVAEGEKVIEQLSASFRMRLFITADAARAASAHEELVRVAGADQMKAMSSLQTAPSVMALFELPPAATNLPSAKGVVVALDAIQNPGNLGTLIRLCDWLGIRDLVLGVGTVDPFSPKVVQATAGALVAVQLYPDVDLEAFLSQSKGHVKILAAALQGTPLPHLEVPEDCIVLFGNEGHGLSERLLASCDELINIPAAEGTVSESLNVSISAAIILSKLSGLL